MGQNQTAEREEARPSLQRLLAIEKDHADLDNQLRQAARIIGLPDNWVEGNMHIDLDRIKGIHFNPRAEWVLRWLLDKLKASDDNARQTRGYTRAWILLNYAVLMVPTLNAARLLSNAGFLVVVQKALQETLASPVLRDFHSTASDSPQTEGGHEVDSTPSKNKKRKRPGTLNGEEQASKKQKSEVADFLAYFTAIAGVLDSIILKTRPDMNGHDNVSCVNMEAVLKTNTTVAAQLLSLWIRMIEVAICKERKVPFFQATAPNLRKNTLLGPILQVWNSRKSDESGDTANTEFSKQCLVANASLMAHLSKLVESSSDTVGSQKPGLLHELEDLVAAHIFIPAREHFLSPRREDDSEHTLFQYLQPLKQKFSDLLAEAESNSEGDEFSTLAEVLPRFYDVAIRSTPRDTPKRRLAASPWLEEAMKSLADSAFCPIPKDKYHVHPSSLAAVEDMLRIAKTHAVSISTECLEAIIRDYSDLTASGSNGPRWSLILVAMSLDRNLFLPAKSAALDKMEVDGEPLSDSIFSAISNEWLKHDAESSTISEQMRSIIRRLVQDYSYGRALRWFFVKWFSQVEASLGTATKRDESLTSPWEANDLIPVELRSVVETSLTTQQLDTILQEYGGHLKALEATGDESDATVQAKAHASIVLLNGILGALSSEETVDTLAEGLLALYSDLMNVTDRKPEFASQEPAVWSVQSRLFTLLWPCHFSQLPEPEIKELALHIATEGIDLSDQASRGKTSEHIRLEVFSFMVNLLSTFKSYPSLETSIAGPVAGVSSVLIKNYSKPSDSDLKKFVKDPNTVTTTTTFQHEFSRALLRFPAFIELMPAETRRMFFKKLYWDAFFQVSPKAGDRWESQRKDADQALLLYAYVDVALSSGKHEVREAMLETMSTGFEDQPKDVKADLASFSEYLFLRAPLAAVPRKRREQVLDAVLALLREHVHDSKKGKKPGQHAVDRHLSVMVKLMQASNATANIMGGRSGTVAEFQEVVTCLGRGVSPEERLGNPRLVEELINLVLRHIAPSMDQNRNQKIFQDLYQHFTEVPDGLELLECTGLLIASKAILAAPSHFNVDIDTFMESEDRKSRKERYLGQLLQCLTNVKSGRTKEPGLFAENLNFLLDALAEFPFGDSDADVASSHDIRAVLIELRKEVLSVEDNESFLKTTENWVHFHRLLARFMVGNAHEFLDLSKRILSRQDMTPKAYGVLMETVRSTLSRLDRSTKTSLIASLLQGKNEELPSAEAMRLLKMLLETLGSQTEAQNETTSEQQVLLSVLGKLCKMMQGSSSVQQVHMCISCVQEILKEQPSLVSQYGVDTLLSVTAMLAQRSGPWISTASGPAIYLGLCDVTSTLISLHRTKLGGRYHLLMLVLQSLLAALFVPDRGIQIVSRASDGQAAPYTREHAAAFSRTLSTLCSPTVSSASGRRGAHHAHADLVDATKKAKAYAGEYVRLVLLEYVSCVLKGRLVADGMRDGLVPGLWAAMEACGEEGLRNVSFALDASGRAVWRGMVSEWKRGRGSGR